LLSIFSIFVSKDKGVSDHFLEKMKTAYFFQNLKILWKRTLIIKFQTFFYETGTNQFKRTKGRLKKLYWKFGSCSIHGQRLSADNCPPHFIDGQTCAESHFFKEKSSHLKVMLIFFNISGFVESVLKVHNLIKISNSDKLIFLYWMVVEKTKEREVFKAIFKKSPYVWWPASNVRCSQTPM
jgi:hypothetical protein